MPSHEPEPVVRWQEVILFLRARLSDGSPAVIIARSLTVERLAKTCFRGSNLRLAGNFHRWSSIEQMFNDRHVQERFLADVLEASEEVGKSGTFSVNFSYKAEVGWESTDAISSYREDDLERFKPNRKTSALRVRRDRVDILAPRTSELTIIYELKFETGNGWMAIIHSVYPGRDIGNLDGDVTDREGRVFFYWGHPGA